MAVYFAQTTDNRFVKIGYAADVKKRLEGLQTGTPEPLKLLAAIPGDHALERALHQRFAYLRHYREWFRTDPAIAQVAVSAARLQGITPDDDPFLRYAILEPRLIDLLVEAAATTAPDDPDEPFCANAVFFAYRNVRAGLKWRLSRLVGWSAPRDSRDELKTEAAYDAVYERIYAALPDCRGCGCG